MDIKDRWSLSLLLTSAYVPTDIKKIISKSKKLKIPSLAEEFEELLYMGVETWELLLYSILSTYAPPVMINGLPKRPNLHTNMCGEISSAKTAVLGVIEKIAPKSTKITKATTASLEGVAKQGEFQPGIIELAHNGVILIPEFRKDIAKFQLLREAMDNEKITLAKWGNTKIIDSNITFIVASNPKKDFFPATGKMRNAIPFEEGVLSRFDVFIPILTDIEKTIKIVSKLDLLHGNGASPRLAEVNEDFKALIVGMKNVKRVRVNEKQERQLKQAYLNLNIQMDNRPLVILRDLESLCRLVNVITAVDFYDKEELRDGEIAATDDDIAHAISLWEHLIYMRKQLYEVLPEKKINSIEEEIMASLSRSGGDAPLTDILDNISGRKVCSQATFYRYLKKMENNGEIERAGKPSIISLSV